MSGPKVVRIVTREELIAICDAHLARLDTAIRQWERAGKRNNVVTEADIEAVRSRRGQIAQLLSAEDFTVLQKQATLEIDFLERDTQLRIELATKRLFETKQRGRRNEQAGRALLAALEKGGCEITEDLRQTLENASGESPAIDAAISQAIALLTPNKSEVASLSQSNLAAYYADGEERQLFPDWLSKQADANTSTFRKLDKALAELTTITDSGNVESLIQRTAKLSNQPISDRSELLIDSLVIDVIEALKLARTKSRMFDQLEQFHSEVVQLNSPDAQAMLARIAALIKSRDENATAALLSQLPNWLDGQRRDATTALRRTAMLKGLAELGYIVNEGLETAWAKDGKVILRKAATIDYGLEVGGGQGDKMQLRVVGFSAHGEVRDTTRDRDIETIWCGDFGRLKASLTESGSDLIIEKALEVGAVPVKIIVETEAATDFHLMKPTLRSI